MSHYSRKNVYQGDIKILKDEIEEFIPNGKVNFVILGTMASFVARSVDGKSPKSAFYYHDGRNRFWGVLSMILTGHQIKFTTIEKKKAFLNQYGIAIGNLIESVEVADEVFTSEDKVLFEARNSKRIKYKKVFPAFCKILSEVPIYFTCLKKDEVQILIDEYFEFNGILKSSSQDIQFLTSPTMKSYLAIADSWKENNF